MIYIEFCCGHTNTDDVECSGYSNKVTSEEMINKIHDIMLGEDTRDSQDGKYFR